MNRGNKHLNPTKFGKIDASENHCDESFWLGYVLALQLYASSQSLFPGQKSSFQFGAPDRARYRNDCSAKFLGVRNFLPLESLLQHAEKEEIGRRAIWGIRLMRAELKSNFAT
jgi:hypothetical protein